MTIVLEGFVTDSSTSAPIMGIELLLVVDSGINRLGSWHFSQLICCLNSLDSTADWKPYMIYALRWAEPSSASILQASPKQWPYSIKHFHNRIL